MRSIIAIAVPVREPGRKTVMNLSWTTVYGWTGPKFSA